MAERISPTSDLGFRKSLSSPESKDVLQGLIGDFFNVRPALDDITITSPYSIKAYKELLKLADGTEHAVTKLRQTIKDISADFKVAGFGVEIQISKSTYFSKRSIYYACDSFCANYNRPGEMEQDYDGSFLLYSSLKPIFALNILGYPHFPGDDDALRIFRFYDPDRNKAFDKDYLAIAYFELTKSHVESVNLRHWWHYFNTGEASDDAPEYIKKASRIIDKANLTQEERDMIGQIERAEEIYKDTIYTARIEGEKIGEARGEKAKEHAIITIARNALHMGMTIADASQLTGMAEDEIRKLSH